MIHRAKDLSPEQKIALERLVGHSISDQEDISIRVLQPAASISAARRQEIVAGLNAFFAQVDAQRQPVATSETDDAIDEALRSSRPDYRPRR